jgi:hypothetical protein
VTAAFYKVLPQYFPGGTEENYKILSEYYIQAKIHILDLPNTKQKS